MAPEAPAAEGPVADVREARADAEEVVLVCMAGTLVIIDEARVAWETRVHVEAHTLAAAKPHGLLQDKRHQAIRARRVLSRVDLAPEIWHLVLVAERARRDPDRHRPQVATHGHARDLQEGHGKCVLAGHVEHHATEGMVLVVSGVHSDPLVHHIVGNLRPVQHRRQLHLNVGVPVHRRASASSSLGAGETDRGRPERAC
mmetsp:Transcript_12987/g.40811  ORF Transcript_12987/g.40811 Transcript_12987/m.40811 type:complete len:200 (-) Transcript_12987:11-610(-)